MYRLAKSVVKPFGERALFEILGGEEERGMRFQIADRSYGEKVAKADTKALLDEAVTLRNTLQGIVKAEWDEHLVAGERLLQRRAEQFGIDVS